LRRLEPYFVENCRSIRNLERLIVLVLLPDSHLLVGHPHLLSHFILPLERPLGDVLSAIVHIGWEVAIDLVESESFSLGIHDSLYFISRLLHLVEDDLLPGKIAEAGHEGVFIVFPTGKGLGEVGLELRKFGGSGPELVVTVGIVLETVSQLVTQFVDFLPAFSCESIVHSCSLLVTPFF
jgi:hypothetical protein